MTDKNTSGPAFPNYLKMMPQEGMTLRDYFAAKALQGLLADLPKSCYGLQWQSNVAQTAYELADILLEARK